MEGDDKENRRGVKRLIDGYKQVLEEQKNEAYETLLIEDRLSIQ